jgi:hypothetical protein
MTHPLYRHSFLFNPEDVGDVFLRNVGWLCGATWSYMPERLLHKHRCENLKVYMDLRMFENGFRRIIFVLERSNRRVGKTTGNDIMRNSLRKIRVIHWHYWER